MREATGRPPCNFLWSDLAPIQKSLDTPDIQGHHTADRIYQKYESVLKNWNMQRCVIRVVTDSASNMNKVFNLIPGMEEEAEPELEVEEVTAGPSSAVDE